MTSGQPTQTLTACEYGTGQGQISCPLGQEVYIVDVVYGRTHALPDSACNVYKVAISNYNCAGAPLAKTYVQNTCSAQSKCTIASSAYGTFGDPCPGVPKFLKIDYQCIVPTTPSATTTVAMTTSSSNVTTTASATTTVGKTTTLPVVVTTTGTAATTAPAGLTTTLSNPKTFRTTTLAPNVCEYIYYEYHYYCQHNSGLHNKSKLIASWKINCS